MSLSRFTTYKLEELKDKLEELRTLLNDIKSLDQTGNSTLSDIKNLVVHPTSQHFLGEWALGAESSKDIFSISGRAGRFLGFQARIYGISDPVSFRFQFQIDDPTTTYSYSIAELRIFSGIGSGTPVTNTYSWINIIQYDTTNNYYTLAWLMPLSFKESFLFRVYNFDTVAATVAIFSAVELY